MKRGLLLLLILLSPACQRTAGLEWKETMSAESLREPVQILSHRCISCHNPTKHEGDFGDAHDIPSMVRAGRIVPGNPEESRLYVVMKTAFMPPQTHLDEEEVDAIRKWISQMDPFIGDENFKFDQLESEVLKPVCLNCHDATHPGNVQLVTYEDALRFVVKGQPDFSLLYEVLFDGTPNHSVTDAQKNVVREWIFRDARK
ncbi:MAG: c-type cytochrome [Bdellovibrionia bacterium]